MKIVMSYSIKILRSATTSVVICPLIPVSTILLQNLGVVFLEGESSPGRSILVIIIVIVKKHPTVHPTVGTYATG